ncbi:unnamed protein product, partial [Brassicogethes aeneus]
LPARTLRPGGSRFVFVGLEFLVLRLHCTSVGVHTRLLDKTLLYRVFVDKYCWRRYPDDLTSLTVRGRP